jgi:hypothetical protein
MAQVVSRRPVTAEAWVRARVNPCEICGGKSGIGTGFSPSSSGVSYQYHSTIALQTHVIWGMRYANVSRHPRLGLTHPTFRGKEHSLCLAVRHARKAQSDWEQVLFLTLMVLASRLTRCPN